MSLIFGFNDQYLPAFGNNWKRFLTFGILLLILGCLAIYASTYTTLATVTLLGFLIFLGGAVILFDTFTFWWSKWSGFLLHFILSLIYLYIGIILIKNPLIASITLTFMLGVFYIAAGAFRLGYSAVLRSPQWGWVWFNGVITLILGVLILMSWPSSSLWIIGLFIGIDLVFSGWAYIMSSLAARNRFA